MMWRNSGSFSSTLVSRTRPNSLHSPLVSPYRGHPSGGGGGGGGGILYVLFAPSLSSHLHSSSSGTPSPFDSLKLGLTKPLQSRPFILSSCSSSAALSPSSSISKAARDAADALQHYSRCYWELSKARLSLLVVATSGTGFVLGSGGVIDFAGLCFTCAGTMMVAASANSLNQVFEINNDAKMKRTMQRPLPSGRISVLHAIMWASSVGVAGTTLLAWKANALTAGLAASTLALYAFVYTPLKQIHPINTWVGAVVGAIPPLLGLQMDSINPIGDWSIFRTRIWGCANNWWTAAYGQVSLNGMILPAALYFWQIPHFMALAYLCRNDYAAGGFKMFSLADASGQRTALVALRNCLYLLPLGFLASNWGITSEWFCIESSLFTLFMSAGALSFYWNRTTRNARRMFHASLLYLPVFMSGLLLHRLPNSEHEFTVTDSDTRVSLSFSKSSLEVENTDHQIKPRSNPVGSQARPPVAYASVAPFPFLPAPLYVAPDP